MQRIINLLFYLGSLGTIAFVFFFVLSLEVRPDEFWFMVSVCSAPPLVLITLLTFTQFIDFIRRKKHYALWLQFADRVQSLTVHTGKFWSTFFLKRPDIVVSGNYRGRYLELAGWPNEKNAHSHLRVGIVEGNQDETGVLQSATKRGRLVTLIKTLPNDLAGEVEIHRNQRWIEYYKPGIIQAGSELSERSSLLADLIDNYSAMVTIGGEMVTPLQRIARSNKAFCPLAIQLLRDIGEETAARLSHTPDQHLCPDCLTHCGPHHLDLPGWASVVYHGCRTCGQSLRFLRGKVVAVLDERAEDLYRTEADDVWVNWLVHREIFDFHRVSIQRASDEDVERFAVQVGNDTDPIRQPRYRQMSCYLSPDNQLSENTMRILERTFAQILRH